MLQRWKTRRCGGPAAGDVDVCCRRRRHPRRLRWWPSRSTTQTNLSRTLRTRVGSVRQPDGQACVSHAVSGANGVCCSNNSSCCRCRRQGHDHQQPTLKSKGACIGWCGQKASAPPAPPMPSLQLSLAAATHAAQSSHGKKKESRVKPEGCRGTLLMKKRCVGADEKVRNAQTYVQHVPRNTNQHEPSRHTSRASS